MYDNTEHSLLVSVIIPCYNQAHFLHEAIESVLTQTYPHFEIIVVDDGSPDNASEVAARYPNVSCIRQKNQGLPSARNAGFRVSKGCYLIFLDSDDRLLPNALEVAVSSLIAHPECGYVAGHVNYIALDGSPIQRARHEACTKSPDEHYAQVLSFDHTWTPAAVTFRRTAFESVGGYDTSPLVKGCEDYDICLRILSNSASLCHNQVAAEYRIYESSMSSNVAMMWQGTLNALHRHRNRVKGNKRYEEAYYEGVQRIHEWYSEEILDPIRDCVRTRHEWKKTLYNIMVLAKYRPQIVLREIYRKFYCVLKGKGDFAG